MAMLAAYLTLLFSMELQGQGPPKSKPAKPEMQEELPPEEDVDAKPKEYVFNPLQAEKELSVGNFNMHRGKYRPAAERYREATKWNPSLAEAWLKLGEAEEKAHHKEAARQAYAKFLEVAPDAKEAREVRKKLDRN